MYQFVVQVLDPYALLLIGLVVTTIWQWRLQKPRSRALKMGSVLLGLVIVLSTQFSAHVALRTLDVEPLPAARIPARGDTIVVLSAGLHIDDDAGENVRLDESSLQRCIYATRLYKQAGGCRMILTGGKVDWDEPGPSFAAAMRDFLLEFGVRRDDIALEERASTTFENALFTKTLLAKEEEGRIWLVTDTSHMNRAARCFRKQGIDVIPAPCDFRSRTPEFGPTSFVPSSRAFAQVSRAAHEWLGRAWYRLRGRI